MWLQELACLGRKPGAKIYASKADCTEYCFVAPSKLVPTTVLQVTGISVHTSGRVCYHVRIPCKRGLTLPVRSKVALKFSPDSRATSAGSGCTNFLSLCVGALGFRYWCSMNMPYLVVMVAGLGNRPAPQFNLQRETGTAACDHGVLHRCWNTNNQPNRPTNLKASPGL